MRLARSIVIVTIVTLAMTSWAGAATWTGSASWTDAAIWPHIGSSRAQIERVWKRDPRLGASYCLGPVCAYVYRDIHIYVSYVRTVGAAGFEIGGYTRPWESRYLTFLSSLLPSGSRRQECRSLESTDRGRGPASACVYRWKGRNLLLVQYIHPSDRATEGGLYLGRDLGTLRSG